MIRRRSLRTRAIKMLVLDEADEMLNKGRLVSDRVSQSSDDSAELDHCVAFLQILSNICAQVLRSRFMTCTDTCLLLLRWF